MKVALLLCALMISSSAAFGQARKGDFKLTKITKNLLTTPEIVYTGAQKYPNDQTDRWLEVEVEFVAAPEFTDELTFKYFILVNGRLLTGEVTHANIAAGRENRSVMYVAPRTLARLLGNKAVTAAAIRCAVLCRYRCSASALFSVTMRTCASSVSGCDRSTRRSFTTAASAASASRGEIVAATADTAIPDATACWEPSGSVIVTWLISTVGNLPSLGPT